MSLCANITSKTTNRNVDITQDIHPTESAKGLMKDKKNSFNYNLKKCRTLTEPEYRQLMLSKKNPLSKSSNERKALDLLPNQIIKESDIHLEELPPRYLTSYL